MNTRSYRRNRLALERELEASAARRKINEAERARQMTAAAIESAALLALFRTNSEAAWTQLAAMTERQRVNAAIDMACYLESQGKSVAWGDILARWERKLEGAAR
jgi:hypothetical protein